LSDLTRQAIVFKKQKIAGMTDETLDRVVVAAETASGRKVVVCFYFGTDSKSVVWAYCKSVPK